MDKSLTKEILLITIPLSLLFAVYGMDFIGFYTSSPGEYSRSLSNVFWGFALTTIGLFVFPFLVNHFRWKKPQDYFGTTLGNRKAGLFFTLAYLPAVIILYINAKDPSMINTYPLSKDVLSSWSFFILYELLYIVFYYIPYEYFFRGVLQLGLSRSWGRWGSIAFVTVLTTALHATKPLPEIAGAAFAGLLLGYIADRTQSWFYPFIIHIVTGVSTDIFCSLFYLGVL